LMAAEATQIGNLIGKSAADIGLTAAMSAPPRVEPETEDTAVLRDLALLDFPLLDGVFIMVGPLALAHLDASCRWCHTLLQGDALWERLAKLIWPMETILPVLHRHYPTARSLVSDRNRRGAHQAWRLPPSQGQGRWHWKFNDVSRFYSGQATLAVLDVVRGCFCLHIHAQSNMPDLRPPHTSNIYEAPFVNADWHDLPCSCPLRRLPFPEFQSEISSPREQKGILRWQASHFSPGCSYAFAYATQNQRPQTSDYPLVPLFTLSPVSDPEEPAGDLAPRIEGFQSVDELRLYGEALLWSSNQQRLSGLRALEKFASSVDGAFYVPPDHVEREQECSSES